MCIKSDVGDENDKSACYPWTEIKGCDERKGKWRI